MCGIVGYMGPKPTSKVLLEGLKALEYRGYDSSGLCVLNKGKFSRFRAAGKVRFLEDKVKDQSLEGFLGIAHTRWATHGAVLEKNAHPHQVGDICIVHNGIIENHLSIKSGLVDAGRELASDTDSEVIAHLISRRFQAHGDFVKAVIEIQNQIEGAYSVLVLNKNFPTEMLAFKWGPPLVIGKGRSEDGEYYIASDAQAFIKYTSDVYYVKDHEVIYIKDGEIQSVSLESGDQLSFQKVEFTKIHWSAEDVDKNGYSHYMLKEIFEQPQAVSQALQPHIQKDSLSVDLQGIFDTTEQRDNFFQSLSEVHIVACGTSFYAGMYGKYVIEKLVGLSVHTDIASEFRYRQPILKSEALVIFISQSGETADTLAALRLAKQRGVKTLSICNTPLSSIDRESDFSIYMNSGVEIGVASTKAFTGTLSLLAILSLSMAKARDQISEDEERQYTQSLLSIPSKLENVLAYNAFLKEASQSLKSHKGFLYMGRGVNYPIAMEGALKLKELAYKHAEGYAAGEMKHGPLALVDEDIMVIMLCPQDELYDKAISNLEEVRARKGKIIGIGVIGDQVLESLSHHFLGVPKADSLTFPILETIPLQLLAFHVANSLGHDVDQPRNLAKSVTVE